MLSQFLAAAQKRGKTGAVVYSCCFNTLNCRQFEVLKETECATFSQYLLRIGILIFSRRNKRDFCTVICWLIVGLSMHQVCTGRHSGSPTLRRSDGPDQVPRHQKRHLFVGLRLIERQTSTSRAGHFP